MALKWEQVCKTYLNFINFKKGRKKKQHSRNSLEPFEIKFLIQSYNGKQVNVHQYFWNNFSQSLNSKSFLLHTLKLYQLQISQVLEAAICFCAEVTETIKTRSTFKKDLLRD